MTKKQNKIGKKGRTKAQREKKRISGMGGKSTVRHTNWLGIRGRMRKSCNAVKKKKKKREM